MEDYFIFYGNTITLFLSEAKILRVEIRIFLFLKMFRVKEAFLANRRNSRCNERKIENLINHVTTILLSIKGLRIQLYSIISSASIIFSIKNTFNSETMTKILGRQLLLVTSFVGVANKLKIF